jgi:phospholipase/carboxylesterase
MNRIALATHGSAGPISAAGSDGLVDVISSKRQRLNHESDEPLATFAPIHYEPGYAYPLVVWLHTSASNERELRQVMPLVSMRNYVAVAPRGTAADPRRRNGFCWRQSRDDIEVAESRVARSIAVARQRFNIHDERIYLAGCGAGGTMALRIAWNEPTRFAGVVAINGPLPKRLRPMWRVNELRRLPCLLATSRDSRTYPAQRVCSDLKLLHAAGCTVALRQYPGADDLTRKMLSDMDRWLMEQVCGGKVTSGGVS